jgi:hypothetical protein
MNGQQYRSRRNEARRLLSMIIDGIALADEKREGARPLAHAFTDASSFLLLSLSFSLSLFLFSLSLLLRRFVMNYVVA